MKALTLHQPWASLIAVGAKRIETRSWSTKYRGPLAIHAGAKRPPTYRHSNIDSDLPLAFDLVAMASCWEWTEHQDDPFHGGFYRWGGPLGAVVATCELVDVVTTDHPGELPGWIALDTRGAPYVDANEATLGDYSPGRYAWLLDNIVALKEPIPAKGKQGLWEWIHGCYICQPGAPWADEEGCSDCEANYVAACVTGEAHR